MSARMARHPNLNNTTREQGKLLSDYVGKNDIYMYIIIIKARKIYIYNDDIYIYII